MHRIVDVLAHTPFVVGQSLCHRRSAPQGLVSIYPVVKIAPQPQVPLQVVLRLCEAACASDQACLLAAHRAVETLQMRGVDLLANVQSSDASAKILLASKQSPRLHSQQSTAVVADFLNHSGPDRRRCLEVRMFSSAPAGAAATMTNLAEHFQDRTRIRQMIIHQKQQHVVSDVAPSHRSDQLFRQLQGARSDTHFEQEPARHYQGRMNPCLSQSASCPAARLPHRNLFLGGQTRPCTSSSCTAPSGARRRAICNWWKSLARGPAWRRTRCTVRRSTSQIFAAALIEQPCDKHFRMRCTAFSGILVYSRKVPRRSLKRCPQYEQYSRRMSLRLPIHSTTLRLPASNRLNSEQSSLGQASPASGFG